MMLLSAVESFLLWPQSGYYSAYRLFAVNNRTTLIGQQRNYYIVTNQIARKSVTLNNPLAMCHFQAGTTFVCSSLVTSCKRLPEGGRLAESIVQSNKSLKQGGRNTLYTPKLSVFPCTRIKLVFKTV